MNAPQTTAQWDLASTETRSGKRADLIKIRRSDGRYQWVTPRELELLNTKKDRDLRIRRLRRQRNAATALAAMAVVLATAVFLQRLWRPASPPLALPVSDELGLTNGLSFDRARTVSREPGAVSPAATVEAGTLAAAEANGNGAVPATVSRAAIEQRVDAWAEAWARQDAEPYLACYSSKFVPPDGISRARWERLRRQRIAEPAFIEVELSDLEIHWLDGSPVARFVQSYRAPGYHDRVVKTLEMVEEEGGWRIGAERSSPLPAEDP